MAYLSARATRLLLIAAALSLAACAPAATRPATSSADQTAEVLEVVQGLFDAMAARDTAAARRILMPDGRFFAVQPGPGGDVIARASPHEEFIAALGAARERWLERMWNPEVRVHGPIAMLWAPYDFYRGGEFSHCGVDAVTLIRDAREWRISGITYTVERERCPPSPLGRP